MKSARRPACSRPCSNSPAHLASPPWERSFFAAFADHLPTHALAITAWVCLLPLAATFLLVFKLPMHAREPHT